MAFCINVNWHVSDNFLFLFPVMSTSFISHGFSTDEHEWVVSSTERRWKATKATKRRKGTERNPATVGRHVVAKPRSCVGCELSECRVVPFVCSLTNFADCCYCSAVLLFFALVFITLRGLQCAVWTKSLYQKDKSRFLGDRERRDKQLTFYRTSQIDSWSAAKMVLAFHSWYLQILNVIWAQVTTNACYTSDEYGIEESQGKSWATFRQEPQRSCTGNSE